MVNEEYQTGAPPGLRQWADWRPRGPGLTISMITRRLGT